MTLIESLDKSVQCLENAEYHVIMSIMEVRKYQHPVAGELAGILQNIVNKISRLKELKKWEEEKRNEPC